MTDDIRTPLAKWEDPDSTRRRLLIRYQKDFPVGPHGPEEAIDSLLDEFGWDDATISVGIQGDTYKLIRVDKQ